MIFVKAKNETDALRKFGNIETRTILIGCHVYFRGESDRDKVAQKTGWAICPPLKCGNLAFPGLCGYGNMEAVLDLI